MDFGSLSHTTKEKQNKLETDQYFLARCHSRPLVQKVFICELKITSKRWQDITPQCELNETGHYPQCEPNVAGHFTPVGTKCDRTLPPVWTKRGRTFSPQCEPNVTGHYPQCEPNVAEHFHPSVKCTTLIYRPCQ